VVFIRSAGYQYFYYLTVRRLLLLSIALDTKNPPHRHANGERRLYMGLSSMAQHPVYTSIDSVFLLGQKEHKVAML
jgi:hypothetical protein